MTDRPVRVHLVVGGFPPGAPAGHDHDYARLRILQLLQEKAAVASVANDFEDVEKWLPLSQFLVTYTAGPVLNSGQAEFVTEWMRRGGRWLGLHGTSGGKAARIEGSRQRRMVKLPHHEALGAFFINHPPVRRFSVDVHDADHPLTKGLPASFEVVDEPYMVEALDLERSRVLLTAELGPDNSPPGFGFQYDTDTALLPDGKTRVIAFTRDTGAGGVTYITLGHCHSPASNSQPFVEKNVDPEGRTPGTLRVTWESPAFEQLLENALDWGLNV